MTKPELKPCECDFHKEAVKLLSGSIKDGVAILSYGYFIGCENCGDTTLLYDTKQEAIDDWNQRND